VIKLQLFFTPPRFSFALPTGRQAVPTEGGAGRRARKREVRGTSTPFLIELKMVWYPTSI